MSRQRFITTLILFSLGVCQLGRANNSADWESRWNKLVTEYKKETIFKEIKNFKIQFNEWRKNHKTSDDKIELELDQLIGSLDLIPKEKEFDKTKCEKYENAILFQFEPSAEDLSQVKSKPVKNVLTLLKKICTI